MIGKLTGMLSEKNPPEVLVDCNGVGYEVHVPMSTFYNLPVLGEKITLLTHFVVREDAQLLYGFGTAMERDAFRQLIKVSGVGPRMALAVLSGMGVAELPCLRHPRRGEGGGQAVPRPPHHVAPRAGARSHHRRCRPRRPPRRRPHSSLIAGRIST